MIDLHGKNFIGGTASADGAESFRSTNPRLDSEFGPLFTSATPHEIDSALNLAASAFSSFRTSGTNARAAFLEAIIEELEKLGDQLLETAHLETGYPLERCAAERSRAVSQAKLFADLLREGSWIDARIDLAEPGRSPVPKPDVRSMMRAIGPIAVFGASNFPIAISVAGADTISAFAAGCPVVLKAHPAHPATCELAARAILAAAEASGLPDGVFSMVHGKGNDVGLALVRHSETRAVAFTGSLKGGRALFDAAASRGQPIPFYGEMGSINPIFILPSALPGQTSRIVDGYVQSLNMGTGQFCTNPGLVLGVDGPDFSDFVSCIGKKVAEVAPSTMLHRGIREAYVEGVNSITEMSGVSLLGRSARAASSERTEAACTVFEATGHTLRKNHALLAEVFGPASTIIRCDDVSEFAEFAGTLDGSLTASIHGTAKELSERAELIALIEDKVGRIIFNGFPTGIEVCPSMHHGGPYPATTHSHFTSIGTRCIDRFVRPICYQDWPDHALPLELRDRNSTGILRLINNRLTRENC